MDRVVVYKRDAVWLVQTEGRLRGGKRPVLTTDEFESFTVAHQAALEHGVPVYVPKYLYDPLVDEPGWNEPDGADRGEITAFVHEKLRPR